MTVETDYGLFVSNGTSSLRIVDCESYWLAGDWSSKDPYDGFRTFMEATRATSGKPLVVTLDKDNRRLEAFYRKQGFRTALMVKE